MHASECLFFYFQIPRVKETWTVVISVKERCQFVNSCTLDCGFRVTKINGYDITKSNSAEVGKILKSCKNKKGIITLRVYEPYSVPSLDAHVESQKLLNPLLNNSNSSSISSVSGISQSEDIKLESLSKDHRRKKNQSQLQVKSSKTSGEMLFSIILLFNRESMTVRTSNQCPLTTQQVNFFVSNK